MVIEKGYLRIIDAAALAGVSLTLIAAFFFQLAWGELPCAFCNLIRVALMIFGGGLLLNLWFGMNPWNYLLSAVGALIGSLISLLFLFVKAPPDSVPTGSAVLGLHMYSWTFIICTGAIMYCVVMLALYLQSAGPASSEMSARQGSRNHLTNKIIIGAFIVLVGTNVASAFLQNGFGTFKPGGQKHYRMLYDGDVMKA